MTYPAGSGGIPDIPASLDGSASVVTTRARGITMAGRSGQRSGTRPRPTTAPRPPLGRPCRPSRP